MQGVKSIEWMSEDDTGLTHLYRESHKTRQTGEDKCSLRKWYDAEIDSEICWDVSTSDFRFIRVRGGFFLSALRKKEGGLLIFRNVFFM